MQELYNHLKEQYGDTITNISSTSENNHFIINDGVLVSLDKLKKDYKKHKNYEFTSSDALFIKTLDNGKVQIYFFEFKKLDLTSNEDLGMSKYRLQECIKKMNNCNGGCKFIEELNQYGKNLVDKYHLSLRSKPFDSISLLYHVIMRFYPEMDDYECRKLLFEADKLFFLVSQTPNNWPPINKNDSNLRNFRGVISVLDRLKPYYYTQVFSVNENGFNNWFYKQTNDLI